MARCAIAALATASFGAPAFAQAASQPTGIVGRVTDDVGHPVQAVVVRLLTAIDSVSRVTLTDAAGRYRLAAPPGADRGRLEFRRIGLSPIVSVVSLPRGRELIRDVQMHVLPTALDAIVVREKVVHKVTTRGAPGGTDVSSSVASDLNFPVNLGDLASMLTVFNPGVLTTGDSSALAVSIGGQPITQTALVVDGASSNATSLPSEAVSSVTTFTSTYDVSRGQFSGGQVAATTRSGSDVWQGVLNAGDRDPLFQFGGSPNGPFGGRSATRRIGTGFGGPLVPSWVYVYGAIDGTWSERDTRALDQLSPPALAHLGISADSVMQFIKTVQQLGFQSNATVSRTSTTFGNGLLRFDAPLSDVHTLMARIDWRDTHSAGIVPLFALPQTGGTREVRDQGVLVGLNSETNVLTNQFRVYWSSGDLRARPTLAVPTGSVLVESVVGDSIGAAALQFGGNPYLSLENRHELNEIGDDAIFGAIQSSHRLKLGVVVRQDRATASSPTNPLGFFSFASLQDLELGRASAFTRTLAAAMQSTASSIYGGVYAGDVWRVSRGLATTYGARLDRSTYPDRRTLAGSAVALAPDANADVATKASLSPRLGFAYQKPGSAFEVHGGAGRYRGAIPIQSLVPALAQTGLQQTQILSWFARSHQRRNGQVIWPIRPLYRASAPMDRRPFRARHRTPRSLTAN